MGFSLSMLAVKGKSKAELLNALQLFDTGEREVYPDAQIAGAQFPGDWYVLVDDHLSQQWSETHAAAQLSMNAEVIAWEVEEHVMVSSATAWKNGQKLWSVVHDSNYDVMHLEVTGEPPEMLTQIKQKLFDQQKAAGKKADVDYIIEVPLELAGVLTGFYHDRLSDTDEPRFEILQKINAQPAIAPKNPPASSAYFFPNG